MIYGDETHAVTQAAPCPTSPTSVSPSSRTSPHGGETFDVSVVGRVDCSWTVSADRAWITASPSSVSNGDTVRIVVGSNDDPARPGTVSIGGRSVSITQASGCVAGWTTGPLGFVNAGGSQRARAGGSPACTFDVSDDRWITVSPSRVAGGGIVTVTAAENVGPWRSGTVTISNMNGSAGLRITQAPAPCPAAPRVSPESLEFGSDAADASLQVNEQPHCSYGVTDDRDWITAGPSPVAGGGDVTVAVTTNTVAERPGTVRIGDTRIPVTQAESPCLAAPGVSLTSVDFGQEGGARDVRVYDQDHCDHAVSADEDWITASPSPVWGDGTVEVSVTANTGAARTGTVSISDTSVSVSQEAYVEPCPSSLTSVNPSSRTSPAAGETFNIRASAERPDCRFSVGSNRSWIGVSASRVNGDGTVSITVDPNDGPQRSGTVTIGGRSLSITQANGCPASPDGVPSRLNFGSSGESQTVTLTEDAGCPYPVATDDAWITVRPASVAGNGTMTVEVPAHTGPERMGTVTIGAASVQITQANGCPAAPGGVPGALDYGSSAESQTVTLTEDAGCPYPVATDDAWITVRPASVAGNGTVTVEVPAHTGPERMGTVTIGTASVQITQANGCPASPDGVPSRLNFGSGGESQTVTLTEDAGCPYPVATDDAWITVRPASVAGNGTVAISVPAHTGPERMGTVTIGAASVQVTQANGCPASPGGVPGTLDYGSSAESQAVTLTEDAGCPYPVATDDAWITVRPASVAGNGTVTVEVPAHTGPERMGTVTIGAASVQVTQANGCPASPGGVPGTLDYGSSAESQAVTLTEDAGCPYPVATDAAWITVDPASVAGNGTVTVTVTANNIEADRTGTVTIGAASVQVTQAAGCPASPDGVPGRLDYGSGAASQAVALTDAAGCTYSVATDDAAWITVDPASAAGNGTVTVTVTEHTGTVVRTGTVMIGTASVQITQAGGCQAAPGVTVPLVAFGNGGGMLAVGVGESSVCEYAVTAGAAWVTVQPALVTGGGTVTVTVPEDMSGGGPRRGTVTIGAAGVRVAQGNTPPVAAADAVTTWRETATPVAVLANDTDADADLLAVAAVVTAPAQGTAVVSADGQTVTYTSAVGWAGDETFTYQVTDDVGGTAEAMVTVTVRAATPFTDPVLTVGVTPIKAAHLTEVRTRADAVRVGCGLTAATWTDPVLTAGVTPIKAAHLTEVRTAVTAAYAACTQPAPAWTDPVLTAGVTPIKAAHLLELRDAVIALE